MSIYNSTFDFMLLVMLLVWLSRQIVSHSWRFRVAWGKMTSMYNWVFDFILLDMLLDMLLVNQWWYVKHVQLSFLYYAIGYAIVVTFGSSMIGHFLWSVTVWGNMSSIYNLASYVMLSGILLVSFLAKQLVIFDQFSSSLR